MKAATSFYKEVFLSGYLTSLYGLPFCSNLWTSPMFLCCFLWKTNLLWLPAEYLLEPQVGASCFLCTPSGKASFVISFAKWEPLDVAHFWRNLWWIHWTTHITVYLVQGLPAKRSYSQSPRATLTYWPLIWWQKSDTPLRTCKSSMAVCAASESRGSAFFMDPDMGLH